jgi:glycosyltransferase involved in cell wall biosynthesis
VVETLAKGTPVVLVGGDDNASTELVEEGENGFIVPSAGAEDLAAAVGRVSQAGPELRTSTLASFKEHLSRHALQGSLEKVSMAYRK